MKATFKCHGETVTVDCSHVTSNGRCDVIHIDKKLGHCTPHYCHIHGKVSVEIKKEAEASP